MKLEEQILRINTLMVSINESKSKKEWLFSYWDKNGFKEDIAQFMSIDEDTYSEYVKEYLGDDYERVISKEIRKIVNNLKECDGNEFILKVDNIDFGRGSWQSTSYYVGITIIWDSPVLRDIDFEDYEGSLTLLGSIEGCVEDKLNNTILPKYGAYNHDTMIQFD